MLNRAILPLTLLATFACSAPDADPDAGAAADDTTSADSTSAPTAETVIPTLGADTMTAFVKLRCEDGGAWGATYWNGPGARVVLSSESISYTLPQVVAASGIRYTNEAGSTEWWSKGDTVRFTRSGNVTTCVPDSTVAF